MPDGKAFVRLAMEFDKFSIAMTSITAAMKLIELTQVDKGTNVGNNNDEGANMTTTAITIKHPNETASPAQVSYLTSLCDTRENPTVIARVRFTIASDMLTKGKASKFIDELKSSPLKSKIVQVQPVKETPAPVVELADPSFGYYIVDENGIETVYCFDTFKAKYGTTIKLMKLKKTEVYDYKLGKYVPKGKWIYTGGKYQAKAKLAGLAPISVKKAASMGSVVGFCIRCGRTLTDPESVAAGIGPVCVTYTNWGM